MKKIFDIWNNYVMLNALGFLFLGIAYIILPYDPGMAIDIFAFPLLFFLRAIFVKFFANHLTEE